MSTLEDQIDDLERLDSLRRRARQLQQEAIEALAAKVYIPKPRGGALVAGPDATRPNWEDPSDDVEKALLLRALATAEPKKEEDKQRSKESKRLLREDLEKLRYDDFVGTDAAMMPIFRAALALQALAETPDHVLSEASFACFHQVVQELCLVAPPAWVCGAARAGHHAAPTAFVTAECARALLILRHSLEQTATAAELLGREVARNSVNQFNFPAWKEQDEKFRARSFEIAFNTLRPHLAFSPKENAANEVLDGLYERLRKLPPLDPELQPGPAAAIGPDDRMQKITSDRLEAAAKDVAWNAVKKFHETIKASATAHAADRATGIAENLRTAARIIDELLAPVEQYATEVIDRELAAGTQHLDIRVDAAELIFAANLLGIVSGWDKPKVRAAYATVRPLLSVNGRLLSIRPFDVRGGGYRLNVQTVETIRRLADLVAHVEVDPELEFFERLLRPFEDTRVRGEKKSESGWTVDLATRESKSIWWTTALAANALESVVRMLDQSINRQVLGHFQVRTPESLKMDLDELFYPDFGIAAAKDKGESVALKLQQLRAHAGLGPTEPKARFSMILHGPPGTGKTTLIEAVAKSANVKLVEITPSDIFIGGAEAVERRTRIVFQALSKLTHVVILFDEFDSILLDRGKRDPLKIPTTVIEFLTPGMLPKLKALYDAAKERRISYALATNYLDLLDPAVTRGGRFDEKWGIYPPDPISRLGRLLDQLARRQAEDKKRGAYLDDEIGKEKDPERRAALAKERDAINRREFDLNEALSRVVDAVKCTRSAAMDRLGRPGWYTMPRDDTDFGRYLFGLIICKAPLQDLVERQADGKPIKIVEPEAYYPDDRNKFIELWRDRMQKPDGEPPELTKDYWTNWKTINDWDDIFADFSDPAANWDAVFKFLDDKLLGRPA